jgi:hypothetical protein
MIAPEMTAAPPEAENLFCPDCGYDLRGSDASARCPECGWEIDRAALAASQLPWSYRESIGRWRAYWRTVRLASRPRGMETLAMEVVRPVDERAASRFATITALLAGIPLAGTAAAGIAIAGGPNVLNPMGAAPAPAVFAAVSAPSPVHDLLLPYAAGVMLAPVLPLAIVLAAWLIARSAGMWFGRGTAPAERRERAAALSRYAVGPLAWVPVGLLLLLVANVPMSRMIFGTGRLGIGFVALGVLTFVGGAILVAAVALSWWNTLALLRKTVHPSTLRLVIVAAALPVTWIACAIIPLGVMPWVAGLLRLMVDSLRA